MNLFLKFNLLKAKFIFHTLISLILLFSCSKSNIDRSIEKRKLILSHLYISESGSDLKVFSNNLKPFFIKSIKLKDKFNISTSISVNLKIMNPFSTVRVPNLKDSNFISYELITNLESFYHEGQIFKIDTKNILPPSTIISGDTIHFKNSCPVKNDKIKNNQLNIILENSCLIIQDFESSSLLNNRNFKLISNSNIVVQNISEDVFIHNLKISGGKSTWVDGQFFSGSLNLYNLKKFNLQNLYITNSLAEDALHLKESSGSLNKIEITNSFLDAIDSDLSTLDLENIIIDNSKGDGVDFSLSRASIKNSNFRNISDKAISIGEASVVFANGIQFYENIGIWIAVKDSSSLTYKLADEDKEKLKDNFKTYQKKIFWEKGTVNFE